MSGKTTDTTNRVNEQARSVCRSDRSPLVQLDQLKIHFDTGGSILPWRKSKPSVRAVDGVGLNIFEDDVVAIVGESGCGKTTLGKAAIGLQRPTSGSVRYRGQDAWDAKDGRGDVSIPYREIRKSLQIIHQDPGSSLNPNNQVLHTLEAPLKRWQSGLSRNDRHERIFGLLEHVGMTPARDYADRYPHQLSGGEKQRVALVRSLLMSPDLILADEAISALDVSLRIEMMELMLSLQEEFGTSYLFISHDLSNARYLAEKGDGRIGVMYLGELVEIGSAEQIINNPSHPYTQALVWATGDIHAEDTDEKPIRKVDIPDPRHPPSGCRFHTRCPKAREVCEAEAPDLLSVDGDEQKSACYRVDEDHDYWESPSLTD